MLRTVFIAAGVLVFAAPAFAARDEDPAGLIQAAKIDLQKGRSNAAFDKTERAETSLLNERAAGQHVDHALSAVQKAHADLQNKDRNDAARDLDDALTTIRQG